MFTGIIKQLSMVKQTIFNQESSVFSFANSFNDLELGESIAINGVCLTVTRFDQDSFDCDVSPETLQRTQLGQWTCGTRVNLERSLKANDRLGGHFVTGHVDQTATIAAIKTIDDYFAITLAGIEPRYQTLLVEKGSIAINGVSLTVNQVKSGQIHLMIIPHTWSVTNLNELNPGDRVNVEYDMMAKLIANQIAHYRNKINE